MKYLFWLFFIVSSNVLAFKSFEIDGVRYYLSDPVRKNWHQALRYCNQNGMYLLDLESEEEYNKILKYLRGHKVEIPVRTYWIGGTSLGSNGEFYWTTTGAQITYNGFMADQPDNRGNKEFCLEMNKKFDFRWNDARCEVVNDFICRYTKYFKLKPQTQAVTL